MKQLFFFKFRRFFIGGFLAGRVCAFLTKLLLASTMQRLRKIPSNKFTLQGRTHQGLIQSLLISPTFQSLLCGNRSWCDNRSCVHCMHIYHHISMSDLDTKIPFRLIKAHHFLGIYHPLPSITTISDSGITIGHPRNNFYFWNVTPHDGCTPIPREVLEADCGCINAREQLGDVMTRCTT